MKNKYFIFNYTRVEPLSAGPHGVTDDAVGLFHGLAPDLYSIICTYLRIYSVTEITQDEYYATIQAYPDFKVFEPNEGGITKKHNFRLL